MQKKNILFTLLGFTVFSHANCEPLFNQEKFEEIKVKAEGWIPSMENNPLNGLTVEEFREKYLLAPSNNEVHSSLSKIQFL